MEPRDLDPDEIPMREEPRFDDYDSTSTSTSDGGSSDGHGDAPELARSDVIVRMAYSLLFGLIISVLHSVILALVVFQLGYSLVSQKLPGPRVQHFGNSICAYYAQMLRYLTHNDSLVPFPFSDFPSPAEPGNAAYAPYEDVDARTAENAA